MEAGTVNIKPYVPNDLGDMIFTDDLKKRMARFQNIKKISNFTDADTKELISIIMDLIPNLPALPELSFILYIGYSLVV